MESTTPNKDAPASKALSLRVVRSFGEAEPLKDAWNSLVMTSGTDIYQTFEWCSLWWKHYGAKRDLHLLLFHSGTDLVGILPGFVETLWLGPVWMRTAKPVGADFSLTLCNLPVAAEHLEEVINLSTHYFLGRLKCDTLLLGPLAGPAAHIEKIHAAGTALKGPVSRCEIQGKLGNSIFALPDTFAEYLKTLGGKQRSNFKRMIEQSAKAHQVTVDTVSDAKQIATEFETFCQQHEHQWKADGKLGHFGDWPRANEFNRDLIRTLAPQGKVRFFRILADNQVISSQYCFVFGQTNYWRLPARVRNPEWDRFSLGTVGLVKMIEASIAEGLKTIEGGRGHYGYKVHHGAKEWPLRTVQFVRKGFGIQSRAGLFWRFARLLDLIYYRIWFIRVAPRLGQVKNALWPFWIKRTPAP